MLAGFLEIEGFGALLNSSPGQMCETHCILAHPLYHYFASLLGIRSVSFGFETVEIAPMPGHLTKLSGEMVHPRGQIGVNLQFDDGRVHGNVSLPVGLGGTFRYAAKTQDL
jgi:hypothetical protein